VSNYLSKKSSLTNFKFAEKGISQLIEIQKDALGQVASEVGRVRKMRKFVIATKNKGKLKEIQEILDGLDFEVVSMEEMA